MEHPVTESSSKRAGSYQKGAARPAAKLDDLKVLLIRRAAANGAEQQALAKKYNVSTGLISGIVNGKRWAHVPGPIKGQPND